MLWASLCQWIMSNTWYQHWPMTPCAGLTGKVLCSSFAAPGEKAKSLLPPKTLLSVSVIAPNLSVIDFLTWVTWWGWQQRLIERAACLQAHSERRLHRCRKCRLPRLYLGGHKGGGLPEHLHTAASSSHGNTKNSHIKVENPPTWHLVSRESHCRALPSRWEIVLGNAIYLDSIPHPQPVATGLHLSPLTKTGSGPVLGLEWLWSDLDRSGKNMMKPWLFQMAVQSVIGNRSATGLWVIDIHIYILFHLMPIHLCKCYTMGAFNMSTKKKKSPTSFLKTIQETEQKQKKHADLQ